MLQSQTATRPRVTSSCLAEAVDVFATSHLAVFGVLLGATLTSTELAHAAPLATEGPHQVQLPRYQPIRYLEDYTYLARRRGDDVFDPIKHVPLGGAAYVSFGGQTRLQYELLEGLTRPDVVPRHSVMFVRNLAHADVHLAVGLRVFAQLGSHIALGDPARTRPPDADVLGMHQVFLESRAELGDCVFTARGGRQEMALGRTARWVSLRDGMNVRQTFDLVRLTSSGRTWSNETFLGAVPALERGAFDDGPGLQNRFWGSYWTFDVLARRRLSVEAFYLGRARPRVAYEDISGREVRHVFGTRIDGVLDSGLEYALHAVLQTGSAAGASIRAWGFAGAALQRLPGILSLGWIGVRADALSGDAHHGDGRLGTFHPLFPAPQFFGAVGAIYPTNLYAVHPLVQLRAETVTMEAGCAFFWRQSTDDAVYTMPGQVLASATASDAKFTGLQPSVTLGHVISRHFSVNMGWSHVVAGSSIRAVTRRDVDWFGTWTTFTY
jgi:hypothetical protein